MRESGKYVCPVCDGQTIVDRDFIEYVLHEESGWCACGYRYEYAYGSSVETIGPHEVCSSWSDDDNDWERNRELKQAAYAEAQGIDRGLMAACYHAPNDAAPRLILADWCAENGLPDWETFFRSEAERVTVRPVTSTSV